ncbi:MAG: hypothetical protein WKF73_07370 [Nocardioidaceae bacterium]
MLGNAGVDDARSTRLVVLDPRLFRLLNGSDQDTREAVRSVMGLGPNKVPVQWASSAVFAVINTQGRAAARGAAAAYLAWNRVAGMDAVRADDDLTEQARAERAEARRNLDSAVRRAYRHFIYLGEGDQDRSAPRRPDLRVRTRQPAQQPGWHRCLEGPRRPRKSVRHVRANR